MKKIQTILFGIVLSIMFSVASFAQESAGEDPAYYKSIIDAKNFAFTPAYVIPLTGTAQPLTGGVGLIYNGKTLSVILPYVGQSYSVDPSNTSNSNVQFTSNEVEYEAKEKKKGTMELVFRPKNLQPTGLTDATKLTLTVAADGTASLRIISNNRQPISYTGHILKAKM